MNFLEEEFVDLTSGNISTHIKKISIPASLGLFFNTMYNVVDTYFAGWISTEALAALSLSFPLFFIIIAFVQGISTGSASLLSNAIGSKNEEIIEHASVQVITFAIICYLIVAPFCFYFNSTLFRILGAEGQYLEMAMSYMNLIYLGSFFLILLYAANSSLLARGNSKVIRNYLITGFFLNAFLNPFFMYGGLGVPAMGFKGIAMATVVTMFLGFIYVFYEVIRRGYLKVTHLRDFIPKKKIFLDIAKQSIPAAMNMLTIGIGIFVITFYTKNFGKAAVATYGIGTRIEQITLLPTIGLTVAALTIIGQNNGAKSYKRIKETLNLALKYGAMIVLAGFLMMEIFPTYLFKIFSDDHEVLDLGTHYLRIAALTSWAYLILAVHISALQGMKRPMYALIIGLFRQILAPLIIFYMTTKLFNFGLESIWWSIFAITWLSAIITSFYTRRVINRTIEGEGEASKF